MSSSSPRVTIGVPVYNGEQYLSEALDSLLSQTFSNSEIIISDNASTDGTPAICEHYAAKDSRVRHDRLSANQGAMQNYNRLVAMARGEYFKWAAHDDNCHPRFLSECVAALDANPEAVLCYPATHVIDDTGNVIREYRDGLDLQQATPHERLVAYLRRNFMRRKGLCNPIFGVLRLSMLRKTRLIQDFLSSDRSLLGHLALLGKFIELPEVLFDRRVHFGISTLADHSFAARKAWFNTSVASRQRPRAGFNNYLALRAKHIHDFYRAINELVEDPADRHRCRRALTQLLITDLKWIYVDVKYSLGFEPTGQEQLRGLARR